MSILTITYTLQQTMDVKPLKTFYNTKDKPKDLILILFHV